MSRGFSEIEKLAPHHDLSPFDCGREELNEWLQRHALASQRSDSAQTYVLCQGTAVVGYYALAAGSVDREEAPGRVGKGMPRHPIPVLVLARLAVDRSIQRRGSGSVLLRDALVRAASGAEIIGARALLVNVKDQEARAFYERYDFESSPIHPLQMFLLMKDLRAALRKI
ncbi:MAG: GNAT family N-acetyltransferase [Candidatus Dormibacteria bacterium]